MRQIVCFLLLLRFFLTCNSLFLSVPLSLFLTYRYVKEKKKEDDKKKQITDFSRLVTAIRTMMLKYSSFPQPSLTNQKDCDQVIKHTYTTRWIVVVMVVVSSIEWLLALSRVYVCIFVCNGRRRTRAAIVTYEYVHVTVTEEQREEKKTKTKKRRKKKKRGDEEEKEDEYYSYSSVYWLPSNAFFSGHCWLTKKNPTYIYIWSHVIERERLDMCQKNLVRWFSMDWSIIKIFRSLYLSVSIKAFVIFSVYNWFSIDISNSINRFNWLHSCHIQSKMTSFWPFRIDQWERKNRTIVATVKIGKISLH